MTDNDNKLIAEAKKLHFSEWSKCYDIANKADTEEAKNIIRNIAIIFNHHEEHNNDLL